MSDKPLAGCRILLVEDEYFIGLELDNLLTEAGAELVGPILDVESAMDEVRKDGFGLAVLDVKVRGGLTYDVADELRRHEVPFIFTTGYDKKSIPGRFQRVSCWLKPIDDKGLVEGLARLCAEARRSPPSATSARPL